MTLHSDLDLAYVANFGGNSLSVVKVRDEDGAGIGKLDIPGSAQPSFSVFDPVSEKLYVSNHGDATLRVMNWDGTEAQRLPTGTGSYGITFDEALRRVYVANIDGRSVSVFQLDRSGLAAKIGDITLDCAPWNVAANANTGHLFVICSQESRAHVYAAPDYGYMGWLPLGQGAGESAVVDRASNLILVSNAGDDTVSVIYDDGPVATPTPYCLPAADANEPDDVPANAPVTLMGESGQYRTLHTPGDTDWFTIDIPATSQGYQYYFRLKKDDLNLTTRMDLFGTDGVTLIQNTYSNLMEFVSPPEGGRYLLRIANASSYANCKSYYTLIAEQFPFMAYRVYLPQAVKGGAAVRTASAEIAPAAITRTPIALLQTAPATATPPPALAAESVQPLTSMAVDSSGRVFAAGPGTVQIRNAQGALIGQTEGGPAPQQLLAGDQTLFLSDWGAWQEKSTSSLSQDLQSATQKIGSTGWVALLDPATGQTQARITELNRPSGLALNPSGLWIAETGADRLVLADPKTGAIRLRVEMGTPPFTLAAAQDRVFAALPGANQVAAVAGDGTILWQTELDGLGLPQNLAYDSATDLLYVLYLLAPHYGQVAVMDGRDGRIIDRIEPNLSLTLRNAQALAVDSADGLLVVSTSLGGETFRLSDRSYAGRLDDLRLAPTFGLAVQSGKGSQSSPNDGTPPGTGGSATDNRLWWIDRSRANTLLSPLDASQRVMPAATE